MAVRDTIRRLPGYHFKAHDAPVKLDQNEAAYDIPAPVKAAVLAKLSAMPFNRYPSIDARSLRTKIASHHDWPEEGVVVTAGSNSLIQGLVIACGLDGTVLTVTPTFAVYALEARILGCRLVEVPLLPSFDLPLEALMSEVGRGSGVAFVADPAAPTGNRFQGSDLRTLATGIGSGWLLVLDEAYCQFVDTDHLDLVRENASVVSIRTFSKAFALAGVRLGYGLMDPDIASQLCKVILPFSLSALQIAVGEVVLEDEGFLDQRVGAILEQRNLLTAEIEAVPGVRPFPSQTNFVLFTTPDAAGVFNGLLERGVLVRRQDHLPGLAGCLRVTVGRPEENMRFLEALRDAVAELREAVHG